MRLLDIMWMVATQTLTPEQGVKMFYSPSETDTNYFYEDEEDEEYEDEEEE